MRPLSGGHRHDALCYDSAEHLLAVTVPFLLGGIAAGEPALVALRRSTADLIRAALPAGGGVTFLSGGAARARPAAVIHRYRSLFAGYLAGGAPGIRVVGELPRAAFGPAWDWWARYEAAVNQAYDEFPVWSMCAYDTRVAPEEVLADVRRTHPHSFLPGGRYTANAGYTDPAAFLRAPRRSRPDPLMRNAPLIELTDPSMSAARAALRAAQGGVVGARTLDELLLAVTEAVTNARRHGKGQVRLRAWRGEDRIVVTVADEGPGPADPFAGLLPGGGNGLWLTHLFCDHVVLERGRGGFTIRLTAGNPHWS